VNKNAKDNDNDNGSTSSPILIVTLAFVAVVTDLEVRSLYIKFRVVGVPCRGLAVLGTSKRGEPAATSHSAIRIDEVSLRE
jgi:hypothetical protein